jgi:branched-chain amino acid transport system substrate-binding protein
MAKQNKPEKESGKSNSKQFTRREFLGASGAVIAVTALSSSLLDACKSTTSTSTTSTTTTPASNNLRIGVLVALTGSGASVGVLEWQECQWAANIINAGGWINSTPGITVNGKQYMVEVVAEDVQSTSDGVQSAATKAIYEDKVDFIAGPSGPFAVSATSVTEPAQKLRAIGFCTDTPGQFGADTPFTFLAHNSTVEHAGIAMQYLKKNYPTVKNVALVNADDGSIQYVEPLVTKLLSDNGITVLGKLIGYPNDIVDFSPIVSQILALNPDAVIVANAYYVHFASILKLVRAAGSNIPVGTGSVGGGNDVITIAGAAASTDFFCTGITPDLATDPNSPQLLIKMINDMQSTYGASRTIVAQNSQAVFLIAEAVQAAQSFDPATVRDKWATLGTMNTFYGTGKIGGLKTYGINHAVSHVEPIVVLDKGQVKSGGWYDPGIIPYSNLKL